MKPTTTEKNVEQASYCRIPAGRFVATAMRLAMIFTALAVFVSVSWARNLAITAELDPSEISFGDSAQLTVTVTGQNSATPNLPPVPGLSFDHVGESSQIQIINGAMSASIAHTYRVMPSHPGMFTIPRLKAGNGADAAESNPLVLRVLKSSGAGAPAVNGSATTRNLPAPAVGSAGDDALSVGRNEIGFLRVVLPKKEFRVGEMVPVELKACFRAGAELRLDGLPQLNSDAFTMNPLGPQPARSQELIGGEPFTVFSWPTALTAVKAGEFNLTVEIPTTVTVRQRAARPRSPFGSSFFDEAFNDSFFDSFFGSSTQKQIKLSSAGAGVKILPLPAENRPASFAGAVGQFDISADASPRSVSVGDPVTLKLTVRGAGSFDRVSMPGVENSGTWKTYRPTSKFNADDSVGYAGEKIFEQALVAQKAGSMEVPAIEFSFYDPGKNEFATRATAPISIEVSPPAEGPPVAGAPASTSSPAEHATGAVSATPASARTAVVELKRAIHVAKARPWLVLSVVLAPLGFIPVVGIVRWSRRRARDPKRLRRAAIERAVSAQLESMSVAARQDEAPAFFAAARRALQYRLAERWGIPAETITLAEIDTRMNGEADGFRPIFEFADDLEYSGRSFPVADLISWGEKVSAEIRKLGAR